MRNGFYLIELSIVVAIIALIGFVGWGVFLDAEDWERFKGEHKCEAVAHIRGDVFNTVGINSNGGVAIGIGSTPDKTGWKCDDGKTYYR